MLDKQKAIAQIRSFNRFYTHILGLLDRHILDSEFSLTEARVLLEIGKGCKAHELADRLKIDRSYLSRMIKGFENRGFITKTPSTADSRFNDLALTDTARDALKELDRRSHAQTLSLIETLSPAEISEVVAAMAFIREKFSQAIFPVTIRRYRAGDEEYIIRRHEELYRKEYALSAVFADYVDRGVRKLATHLDPAKECILIPEMAGQPMGSIAIAHVDDQTAQLRYFLLEPQARGHGLGLQLVAAALDFARKAGYTQIFLETISALTTARTIYSRAGFRLVHEEPHAKWGPDVVEERWEMAL